MSIKNQYICGLLTAALFGMTACSDFAKNENPNVDAVDGAVALSVSLSGSVQTKAGGTPLGNTISDGTKVNELTFAVYEVPYDNDGKETLKDAVQLELSGNNKTRTISVNPKSWPVTIHLSLDPAKGYRIVFWAQSSLCDAYTVEDDLRKIEVSYKDAQNNDEKRDAFTGVIVIKPDELRQRYTVSLHRPFAQINIGTTGADYANLIYNPTIKPDYITITESQITVTGVADTYNALACMAKAEGSTTAPTTATFSWSRLPAWIRYENPDYPDYPEYKDEYLQYKKDPAEGEKGWWENPFVKTDNEEFLYVKLNGDHEAPLEYLWKYPTVAYSDAESGKKTSYLTETFKYLSMCYVLVPSAENNEGGTVAITYALRGEDHSEESEEKDSSEKKYYTLKEQSLWNVPVANNKRTNILGGLHDTDDDPSSIFNTIQLVTVIQEKFDNPYFVGNGSLDQPTSGEEGTGQNQESKIL